MIDAKQLIWDLMGEKLQRLYNRGVMKENAEFERFKNRDTDVRSIILLDTPRHGNLGDQAITIAERKLLENTFDSTLIFEFKHEECLYFWSEINPYVTNKDVLLITGGGFVGSLWPDEEKTIIGIMKENCNNRIVILPQTYYFNEKKPELIDEFVNAANNCKELILIARDHKSYAWLHTIGLKADIRIILTPDIVTSLEYVNDVKREKKVVVCLRNDREKVTNKEIITREIADYLKSHDYKIEEVSTIIPVKLDSYQRIDAVYDKLDQFASASFVITDRLHGMLFSTITSTPCIALDNLSKKVSGGYKWLESQGFIIMKEKSNIELNDIRRLEHMKNVKYNNETYKDYYKQIINCIEE